MINIIDIHIFGLSPFIPSYSKNNAAIYVNAHTGQKWLAIITFKASNTIAQPRATNPIANVVLFSISISVFILLF